MLSFRAPAGKGSGRVYGITWDCGMHPNARPLLKRYLEVRSPREVCGTDKGVIPYDKFI
jgi:hypothetical protein